MQKRPFIILFTRHEMENNIQFDLFKIQRQKSRLKGSIIMSKKFFGAMMALLGGMCWGFSGAMGQYLFTTQGMDSKWLVPIRLGMAGIILFIYCLIKYKNLTFAPWHTKRDAIELIIYGIPGISLCQFTYFLTIQLSSAGIATIMQDLSPVMILLVSCLIAKRFPKAKEILCIILALSGIFLITTHGQFGSLSISSGALIAGLVSAVAVTIYNIVPGKLLKKYPVTILQSWAFIMGGALLALAFRPWEYNYVPSAIGIFGIIFVIVVGNVLAFTFYMTGVKHIGPEKATLLGFSEAVTAAIISTLVLGAPFTLWDAVGFVLIFLMLVFTTKI